MAEFYKRVFIAGATGPLLGQKMVRSFLEKKIFEVHVLVQPEAREDERKAKVFEEFAKNGVKLVEASLEDPSALQKALEGIDAVLSLLSGPQIVEGQIALLNAAVKAGVKRFIPSDYGFDLSKVKKGEAWYYDNKIKVQEAVLESGIEYTFIATNLFAEFLYSPSAAIDIQNRRIQVWAPRDVPLSTTHTDDIAKLVPEVLIHPASKNARVNLESHSATFNEIIAAFEKVTGQSFEAIDVPEESIVKGYKNASGLEIMMYFCKLVYRRGDGTFSQPFNKVHPELAKIKTLSVEEVIQKLLNAFMPRNQ